jgi:hypothetical protein
VRRKLARMGRRSSAARAAFTALVLPRLAPSKRIASRPRPKSSSYSKSVYARPQKRQLPGVEPKHQRVTSKILVRKENDSSIRTHFDHGHSC